MCNGTNGTPDLRGYYLGGANTTVGQFLSDTTALPNNQFKTISSNVPFSGTTSTDTRTHSISGTTSTDTHTHQVSDESIDRVSVSKSGTEASYSSYVGTDNTGTSALLEAEISSANSNGEGLKFRKESETNTTDTDTHSHSFSGSTTDTHNHTFSGTLNLGQIPITNGGDSETRPKTYTVNYIRKMS